jgi:hypothetical protein
MGIFTDMKPDFAALNKIDFGKPQIQTDNKMWLALAGCAVAALIFCFFPSWLKYDLPSGFNDKAYNAYYDSVERVYNVAAQQELIGNILNQKTYDERDHTAPVSGKLRDYTPSIVEFANPLGVTHGTEGVGLISDPILSVREAAQKAKVFNTETGKFEDYTPNDLNVLSF